MSISAKHLRAYVIGPALRDIGLYSKAAENLLLGTACQESACGHWLHQNSGPAVGIFQMEPATHDDIWRNWLSDNPLFANRITSKFGVSGMGVPPPAEVMAWNLRYAAAMCRIHYRRVREPLPAEDDLDAMAAYWKRHYNTYLGAGTAADYVRNWRRFAA